MLADGTATYQHGLGLLSEVRGGSTRFYHADALGTTRDLSNSSGAASATLETDAFGNVVNSSGTGTPFGFAGAHGYQTDADTGWQRLGHRFYLPGLGRFLSRDPIRDGYNWYAYCDNDPVNRVDPSGLGFKFPKLPRIPPKFWPLFTMGLGIGALVADVVFVAEAIHQGYEDRDRLNRIGENPDTAFGSRPSEDPSNKNPSGPEHRPRIPIPGADPNNPAHTSDEEDPDSWVWER